MNWLEGIPPQMADPMTGQRVNAVAPAGPAPPA
jgi:hypothetical protein